MYKRQRGLGDVYKRQTVFLLFEPQLIYSRVNLNLLGRSFHMNFKLSQIISDFRLFLLGEVRENKDVGENHDTFGEKSTC